MKYYTAIVVIFFVSCRKEETTNYYATLKNNTTHIITIKPYSNGQIVTNNQINLAPANELEIASGFSRGLNGNAGFSSKYFENADSVRITFDNLYTISHYVKVPVSYNNRYYLYGSLRNILNYLSYNFSSKTLSKYQLENRYLFEFTEQDYLDAKP